MEAIHIQLTIINRADQALVTYGRLHPKQVRCLELDDMRISANAASLCLPANLIQQLGLAPLKEITALTTSGYQQVRVFQDAKISLCGREGVFQCLELPVGEPPLLGRIPLQDLGIEVDWQTRHLSVLPDDNEQTYFRA
ncbi:MAG: aspartyl protease [Acidobacteria bacterium]|nr:aspartyl protease [Acidobacteriota bacterium]